ncbi:MAG: OmpA family protein [Hyphomicrobiales bacterium]|nr:OmpA family protein [Hyphomicrobiales bacterium]
MSFLDEQRSTGEDETWISISDLMSGMMIIFLFIAIFYIRPILLTQDKIQSIVDVWQQTEIDIYDALEKEFSADLKRWNAEIDPDTLTVRFKAPEVLFEQAKAALSPFFEEVLDNFFPRYVRVLVQFRPEIEEVRIEGHTSSEWAPDTPPDDAYINNMELSQERTRAVLEYVLANRQLDTHREWTKSTVTANGLSSSRLIRRPDRTEDPDRSRRVEFRVRTKVKDRIVEILQTLR